MCCGVINQLTLDLPSVGYELDCGNGGHMVVQESQFFHDYFFDYFHDYFFDLKQTEPPPYIHHNQDEDLLI